MVLQALLDMKLQLYSPTTEFVSSNYKSGTVYKVNLATTGTDSTSTTGLKAAPANGTIGVLRANLTHTFNGVESVSSQDPSSALVFDPLPSKVYRTINFGTTDALGTVLGAQQRAIRFDSYIRIH